jgi:SAM-dependent methyltransferase
LGVYVVAMTEEIKEYWDNRYKEGLTGWDIKGVSPPLKGYIDKLENKEIAILIPGCGNAYEAEYLLKQGFSDITLIDIAPTLVSVLKQKFKGESIKIINEDFFKHFGQYDLILEQTFFCAIDPVMRSNYVEQCYSLLKEGGKLAGLLFNRNFEKEGPPFGGTKMEYETLFESRFVFKQFDICTNSIAPRQGSELFIEFVKK